MNADKNKIQRSSAFIRVPKFPRLTAVSNSGSDLIRAMFARRYDLERGTRWLLVGLMLLGFGLRVVALGDKSVWWDEGLAAWAARQSLAAIRQLDRPRCASWALRVVALGDFTSGSLHFWRLLSGESEFGLRLLSAIFGLLTIPATYLLGKRINGRFTGLLAALFITISRFDIGWAQEMRMYALSALLGALALWAAVGVWQYGRRRDWLLYILFMVLGLYNLYLAVMVLVTANLVWLCLVWPRAADRWRNFWHWSLAQTAVLLLYAPWLFYALSRIPTWSQANPVEPWSFLKIYWTVLTVGIPLDVDQYATLTVPVLLVFLLGVGLIGWRARRRKLEQQKLALLLLGLLLPALVVYLVSLPKASFFYSPPLAPRYLIIFLAAFAVLLGWGIDRLSNGRFDIAPQAFPSPFFGRRAGRVCCPVWPEQLPQQPCPVRRFSLADGHHRSVPAARRCRGALQRHRLAHFCLPLRRFLARHSRRVADDTAAGPRLPRPHLAAARRHLAGAHPVRRYWRSAAARGELADRTSRRRTVLPIRR
jgi:hypothetical protein